jgi:hypothetical protein
MHFFISTNTHYFHILFAHLKEKKKERKKENIKTLETYSNAWSPDEENQN